MAHLENVRNPFESFTFGSDIVFESWSWAGNCSPAFKIKVLDGANWDDISCPLFCLLVVTNNNFELLLDGNVRVGIDVGQDIWRCVEIAFLLGWCKSLTRIWVGWICVVDEEEDVDANDTCDEDAKLWSNDVTLFLFLADPDNEDVTPEDETRLGDVFNDTADPKADEEYEVVGFNNDVGISIIDVAISLEVVVHEGIILILLTPPVSSMVI